MFILQNIRFDFDQSHNHSEPPVSPTHPDSFRFSSCLLYRLYNETSEYLRIDRGTKKTNVSNTVRA